VSISVRHVYIRVTTLALNVLVGYFICLG